MDCYEHYPAPEVNDISDEERAPSIISTKTKKLFFKPKPDTTSNAEEKEESFSIQR